MLNIHFVNTEHIFRVCVIYVNPILSKMSRLSTQKVSYYLGQKMGTPGHITFSLLYKVKRK